MATLDQQKFKHLGIALPPIPEQQVIVCFLDYKTAQIDALTRVMCGSALMEQSEYSNSMAALLQEYRSALITNADTGKIDVRSFEIPLTAKEPAYA